MVRADRVNCGPLHDFETRIEGWVVSQLDDRRSEDEPADWHDLIAGSPIRKRFSATGARRSTPASGDAERWSRFRIARRRGVTVLRLSDTGLVRESDLSDLSDELADVLGTGPRRVVLDFGNVERLSCHAVGILSEAHRRFTRAENGTLKVCALQPTVAEVFAVTGLGREVAVHPDERAAIETPWPESATARRLPVTILRALTEGGPIAGTLPAPRPAGTASGSRTDTGRPGASSGPPLPSVRLIAAEGPNRGREIAIPQAPFWLGRDPACQLRSRHPTVSRRHACLLREAGHVVIRDAGSLNGTRVNDQVLRDDQTKIRDGDRIGVGPHEFVVAIGIGPTQPGPEPDEVVAGWLVDDAADTGEADAGATEEFACEDGAEAAWRLRFEEIGGVLVVTPLASHLDDESTVGPLRSGLQGLFERPLPRRVVLDLSRVAHLSSLAIGVMVAHHMRLDRAGGSLRLCALRPRVRAILDEVRLPMLVDVLPTRDEAVLVSWGRDEELER